MTTPKLRITILALNYYPEPTGNAPYTTRLAELLVNDGHEVRVVTGFPYYPEWTVADGYSGWSRAETIRGVNVRRLRQFVPAKVNGAHRMHMELSFGIRLLFARWHNPDVVLVVSPALFAAGFAVARARFGWSKPSTGIWVQDIYSRGLEETESGGSVMITAMKRLEGFIIRSATKVTVIHDKFAEYLSTELRVPSKDIGTIRNWTHLDATYTGDRALTRSELGWSEGETIVLHAGNMGLKQGLQNVVETARLAEAKGSNVRFVLLGDGNQSKSIQHSAGGMKNIQFISTLPDDQFRMALQSADILLVNELSGLREMSVPSKLTSYFATELPVIAATEEGSTTAGELFLSGGGVRVDPGSPEALLAAVEDLASDPAKMQSLGKAGRLYAESWLSEESAMIQYSAWLTHMAAMKQEA